ncbi:MAG: hypothetical protein AAFQ43_07940 [Bacteroidota bacterium]
MPSVPFTTLDIHGGLSEGKGLLRVDGQDVAIEIQVEHLGGIFSGRTERAEFELTDLDSVRHKRSFTGDKLTLRTDPMHLVTDLPGSAEGEFVLKVKKKHRADLDAVLSTMELWIIP